MNKEIADQWKLLVTELEKIVVNLANSSEGLFVIKGMVGCIMGILFLSYCFITIPVEYMYYKIVSIFKIEKE